MTTKGYTVLGWLVWKIGSWFAKRQIARNKGKLGAAGVILVVLIAGLIAARSGGDE